MKKISTILICLFVLTGIYAQKRNLIANSRFENGYKCWRAEGSTLSNDAASSIIYDIDSVSPISGKKTAKITINTNPGNFWDRALAYYLPMFKDGNYQIRFKVRAENTTTLKVEFGMNHSGWEKALAKNDVTIGTDTKEIVINTNGDMEGSVDPIVSDFNWVFKFDIGSQPNGAVIWIDDISVTKINGNWDGNLVPQGDFEEVSAGWNGWFDIWGIGTCAAVDINNENKINGKSLHIKKTSTASSWTATDFEFFYWQNEGADYEISFDLKAASGSNLGAQLFRSYMSNLGGSHLEVPCLLAKTVSLAKTDTTYHFTINKNNTDSSTYRQLTPGSSWGGIVKVYAGFGADETPVGYEVYLDNVKVKEVITLDSIEIDGPADINKDTTYRIWANPTNADNSVTFTVTNGTGEATIDADGKLTVLKNGTVTINAVSSVNNSKKAQKVVNISGLVKVPQTSSDMVKVFPNPASDFIILQGFKGNSRVEIMDLRGFIISTFNHITLNQSIDLSNVKAGTYLVKITTGNNVYIKKIVHK